LPFSLCIISRMSLCIISRMSLCVLSRIIGLVWFGQVRSGRVGLGQVRSVKLSCVKSS
jgi:hypothetical protein